MHKNMMKLSSASSNWSPGMAMVKPAKEVDFVAILSYVTATALEWGLIVGFLHGLQLGVFPKITSAPVKKVITYCLMAFMSLRSRIFSPLDNSRPLASKDDKVFKRLRPKWQPPPLAFPIIWSTIGLLRTISGGMITVTTGTLLCKPLFMFMLHLSCGDTWNTINNVEGRLGTAALTVPSVLITAAYTTYCYYNTLPLAGKLLAPSVAWLSVANVLVFSIWKLNRVGEEHSLLPVKDEAFRCKWKVPILQ
jgi:tryptophan-rich sensory protein